jgi:hypothetical protein
MKYNSHKAIMRFKAFRRALLLSAAGAAFALCAEPGRVDFDREIRPILSDKCFACHGPDEKARMANLRLDIKDGGIFADRGQYKIVVPGDSANSRLSARISSDKPAFRMPPVSSGLSLTPEQIGSIQKWIDQGAKWEIHWSYTAPKRPDPPTVSNPGWVRNPIDAFVLARLDKEGLKPSREADKLTLIRRVTFDLTGLPPTPSEVDAFLADESPTAYDKVVDRLLHSPRYGERMAMQWLDLARYSDTHGYHIDSQREMWHWRDWVIDAFNKNMPFDQFTIEQLAGDLLPNPTVSQLIATGFNRNHVINFEGGAIPAEYQNEYVVDRLEATAATWMGTTLGCARCHDHKYDPLKQKEFYRFYAFFNNVWENGLDGQHGNAQPFLQLPSEDQRIKRDQLKNDIAVLDEKLERESVKKQQRDWEKVKLTTISTASHEGLAEHYEFDGNLSDASGHYRYARVLKGDLTYDIGNVGKAAEFDGDTWVTLGDAQAFEPGKKFSVSFWIDPDGHQPMAVLENLSDPKQRKGFEVYLDDFVLTGIQHWSPKVTVRLSNSYPDNALEIRSIGRLDPGRWVHVAINYDGSGKASGLKLLLNGKADSAETLKDSLKGPLQSSKPLEIGNKAFGRAFTGSLDDLRIYNRELKLAELEPLVMTEPVRATLMIPEDHRSKDQKERLRRYYLTYEAPQDLRDAYLHRDDLRKQAADLKAVIPTTMVMAERPFPRATFILARGDYRNKGEKVTPGVPAVLPPLPKGAPPNRLSLAKWLVSPENPLTARVVVNRYWQMYFGFGIVKTVEDFGSQGEAPVNQDLLDWLATEFQRNHWDIREMQRLIVTSASYRQDSRVTPELEERDPENRLIARGPRFRLPAEMIRDNALAVSGLLKERVGGPSVKPYQPAGIWEDVAFGDGFSAQSYTQDHGDDIYRRSMYIFWKRTAGPPEMLTFDAPNREKCTARRLLTNTPLQALVLLNDPTFVEASRALAQRMITDGGDTPGKRIDYGFRIATARTPNDKERGILEHLEQQEATVYQAHPDQAAKLLHVGESKVPANLNPTELAAWTTVASTILNLDETITKE